ncbi:CHD3-type chromatin-remodeling factor PICKLE isoform X2 [Physcomitrium patens]|nr:CHD3-type chromatin-remodeling factor PICKLE-like isoform X2 [Physcomitrium patens]XP_024359262.1 CHD3-type chromatin-remodeling factor PICKLE-like isoform X2 [Physcomitrium patens]|eukprot:XP_024359261.1 CHD3-type chromatin-remodeling factor PICKLE-like isoform X2 [Physcomitrella patens]
MKVVPRGKWSCPKCADPLGDVEKFIDTQMRPMKVPGRIAHNAEEKVSEDQPPKLVKQYLVKWKSRSYLHCSWVTAEDLERGMKTFAGLRMKLNHFHKMLDGSKNWNTPDEDRMPIRPEWTTVDRVLDMRHNGDITEYLVKWKELGYDEATWEVEEDVLAFQAEVDKFKEIMSRQALKKRKGSALDNKDLKRRRKDFKPFKKTPKFLVGGSLHPYQLEGLNFLRFAWEQNKHVILADEMGLGKTIQSISLLGSLIEENVGLPHLVVAPLSTLRNWEREFATWCPQMNVVMYVGSSQARAILRQYEFFFPQKSSKKSKDKGKKKMAGESKQDRVKFDVLLTSYEMINLDTTILKALKWECLIVDEGHRLKNKDSKLFQTLTTFSTRHRVLLTGTPLQNNLDELFMLMHFLDAGKFNSLEEFQQEFQDINQEEQVGRLHKMLAPHLLRRVKKDVLKEMPPKKELILRVELSSLQKEFYKAILTKNYQILAKQGGPQVSLTNVVMELRKLCGHPYLLEGVEPTVRNQAEANRQLLENSGKLLLLDKMMTKLHSQGHRVLIYSQFTRMLDILEDWLHLKKWGYERIDGKISGSERQIRIDRYNSPNSTKFCFLLSTRAGGLGINLATADTVIIYDSDWNPHADLQAMARAHRLGQQNKVMIFRLVTRGTIEERMMQMTKKKMVLEHLVVGRMKKENINQEELDDILRYGAMELFSEKDEDGKTRQIHYDDSAIDRLLDRAQVNDEEEKADDEEDSDLLKAFKVANFDYINEEDAAAAAAEEAEKEARAKLEAEMEGQGRAQFWDNLLKDRVVEQQVEEFEELGKGKRSRRQVKPGLYSQEDDLAGMVEVNSDDGQEPEWAPTTDADSPGSFGEPGEVSGSKKLPSSRKRVKERMTGEPPPLIEGEGRELRILGFNHRQRSIFVNVLMRFGLGDFSWSEFIPRLKPKTPEEIKDYGTLFLSHIAEDINDSPFFSDGVPKEGLRIQDVLVRLAILHLIRDKVKALSEDPSIPLFSPGSHIYRYYSLRNTKVWKEEHDRKLLYAICSRHGYGRWLSIVEDPQLGLGPVIRGELLLRGVNDIAGPSKNGEAPVPAEDEGPSGLPAEADREEREAYLQKRMVDFVKRRVLVLEKVLNAEYHCTGGDVVQVEEAPPQMMTNDQAMRGHQSSQMMMNDPHVRSHQVPQTMIHDPGMRGYQSPQMTMNDPMVRGYQSPQTMNSSVGMGIQQQPHYHSMQQMRPPVQERGHPPPRHPVIISPEELAANAYDNEEGRLKVAQIYNQICATVNENEGDAIQAYGGNKSAGLRVRKALREIEILCVDMRNALFDQPLRKTAGRKKKADEVEGAEPAGEGAKDGVDGQSDDGLEDFNEYYDREIDSDIECDVETRRPSSTPPSEPSNEVHEYQFLKKADADVGERSWPHGLQSLKPGMRMDLGGPRQAPPQMTPPAQGTPSVVLQHEEGKWPPAVVYLDRD